MTRRSWGPTGVIESEARDLTEYQRSVISNELRARNVTASEQFYRVLEVALGHYHTRCALRESSKPAETRENLRLARDASLSVFNRELNNLDANALQLLEEARSDGIAGLRAHMKQVVQHLSDAYALAEEYPQSGSLQQYERLYLAADIAAAIEQHTDIEPDATANGLFASLEGLLLGSDSRPLRDRALAVDRIEHDSGLIEYFPPEK